MNKLGEKRALSVKPRQTPQHSQFLCEGCESKRQQWSPGSGGKLKKREKRCVSVKDRSRVASFETSKVSSIRKPKQKAKKKAILVMSQHETPVLGKYFITTNSNHALPQAQLDSISDHAVPEEKTSEEESKLAQMLGEEESTVKAPLSIKSQINRSYIMKVMPPEEVEAQLDLTIDKLKSKQQTIEILNKTIQTRLVDVASSSAAPRSYITREDTYEVEMNFYVEKITLLQKELYEKNRLLRTADSKNQEFSTLARNTKKLIKENTRLREELELSLREVGALKKLLAKAEGKMI